MWQGIQAVNQPPPPLHPATPPYLMSSTTAMAALTGTTRLCSLQTINPWRSVTCAALSRVNAQRVAGPDGVPGRVLRACAVPLTEVWTDVFNLSVAWAAVPVGFKTTSLLLVPKHSTAAGLDDFCPVALTPIITKCFERLVLAHLKTSLPPEQEYRRCHLYRRFTSPSPTSTALTPVWECLLTSPPNWSPNSVTLASIPPSATGFWAS